MKLPPFRFLFRRTAACFTGMAMLSAASPASAGIVFSDDFNRTEVNTGTTVGSTAIGNGWTFQSDPQTPPRGGARIINGVLQIGQNDAGGYAGAGGGDRSWLWQDSATWQSPFTPVLGNNQELVVWTFNLRTGQPNPTPVSTAGGGTAVAVLATAEPGSGDWQFGDGAKGYLVTYNDATTIDPLKLIRMNNGVRNESGHTPVITASTAPFNDLSSQNLSVRVTYDPSNDLWTLYARDDGGAFQDPRSGILTELGTGTDNTWTGEGNELRYAGFLGNSNNGFNGETDDLRFDNFVVSVQTAVETPVFTPAPGNIAEPVSVSIGTLTSGATIRYTTNGTDPTPATGTIYTEPVNITATTTLKAIGYRDGLANSAIASGIYAFKVDTPVFSPVQGTYNESQLVFLTSAPGSASIRYTTDGTDPTPVSGTLYDAPVEVNTTTMLKAIAYDGILTNSDIATGTYTIRTAAPVFSPVAGTYNDVQFVEISTPTTDATIRYTTNGTDPTPTTGTIYDFPFEITGPATIKAIAYRTAFQDSPVVTSTYNLQAGAPVFTPGPGNFSNPQNITITSSTDAATIRYTTDGSDPTLINGTIYTGPVALAGSATIKAIAYKGTLTNSSVTSGVFVISSDVLTIVDDAFNDNDRTGGEDENDVAWYLSTNVAADGATGAAGGEFVVERQASTGSGFNPHFTAAFPEQTLTAGQTIVFSFDVRSAGSEGATNFRFGLYDGLGTNQTADAVGNPPGTTAFNGDLGYSVFAPLHQTGDITLRARSGNAPFPLAAATNTNIIATGSGAVTTPSSPATFFNASLVLTRTESGYGYEVNLGSNSFSGTTTTVTTSTFDTLSIFSIAGQNQPVTIDNVLVTVTSPPGTNSLATWRALQGLAADGSQDELNPSGDGLSNLLKYALNLAPNAGDLALPNNRSLANPAGTTVADLTGLPVLRLNGASQAAFTYIRRKAATSPGISYTVQWSDVLGGWASNPAAVETTLSLDQTWERVTLTDSFTTAQKPLRFARLRIAANP